MKPKVRSFTDSEFTQLKERIKKDSQMIVELVSDSMSPILKAGDSARIQAFQGPLQNLKKNDIVVFRQDGILVCHFVHHLNSLPAANGKPFIVTRGYKNSFEDLPVFEDQILGLVINLELKIWQKLYLWLRKGA